MCSRLKLWNIKFNRLTRMTNHRLLKLGYTQNISLSEPVVESLCVTQPHTTTQKYIRRALNCCCTVYRAIVNARMAIYLTVIQYDYLLTG